MNRRKAARIAETITAHAAEGMLVYNHAPEAVARRIANFYRALLDELTDIELPERDLDKDWEELFQTMARLDALDAKAEGALLNPGKDAGGKGGQKDGKGGQKDSKGADGKGG